MYKLTCILTLVISLSLAAQPKFDNYDVKVGPIFKMSKRSVPIKFIGNDEDGFYFYYGRGKWGNGKRIFASFNYELKLQSELLLDQTSTAVDRWESVNIFPFGNNYNHIVTHSKMQSTSYPLSSRFKSIYVQKIDQQRPSLGEKKLLTSIPGTESYNSFPIFNYAHDSTMILLSYAFSTHNVDNQLIGLHAYDTNWDLIWEKRVEIPYEEDLLDIRDYRLDKKENVYVLAKRFYNKRKEKVKGEVNYDYLIFKYSSEGLVDSIKVEPDGKFAKDLRIEVDQDDNLIVAGFYSENKNVSAGGIFYLKLDGENADVMVESVREFDKEILTSNMTEGQIKRTERKIEKGKDVELPFFHIDDFVIDENGETKIIAEKRHIYTVTMYSPQGSYSTTHFDYGDVMVIEIDKNGEIEWVERVAKNQHTQNDGAIFSSYASAIYDDEVYLIYNDNAANLHYNGAGRIAGMTKGSATMVMINKVNSEGVSEKTALFDRADVNTRMRPELSYQVSDDEMLVFGYQELKNQRFILIKFK